MGAEYIDYIIADQFVVPDVQMRQYGEKIVYLPNTFQANNSKRKISDDNPSRAQAGLPESAFVFCSLNNSYKITPIFFDIWMRILQRVDGSILWLLGDNTNVERNMRKEAERRGVDPARLIFASRVAYSDYLARLRLADLFLDSLPFNAGTTASDVLWAGLPMITCSGEAFAGRMAGSLLITIGLPELIASSQQAYENLAIDLSTNPDKLAVIRSKLAMQSSHDAIV